MAQLLEAYVLSRGQISDYRDLGPPQRDSSWFPSQTLSSLTDPTRPMVLIKSKGDIKSLRIAGITSSRRDQSGTPIRFDFTVVWSIAPTQETTDVDPWGLIVCLLQDLKDVSTPSKRTRLGDKLDEIYPASKVEQALNQPISREQTLQMMAEVCSNWAGAAADTQEYSLDWGWVGGFEDTLSKESWLQCAKHLITKSENGGAFILNTISNPGSLMVRSMMSELQPEQSGLGEEKIAILGRGQFSLEKIIIPAIGAMGTTTAPSYVTPYNAKNALSGAVNVAKTANVFMQGKSESRFGIRDRIRNLIRRKD